MKNKITIFPCSGVGQVFGTITRQVAYKIIETLPDDTLLLCLPALVKKVQEDLNMLKYPIIVIEGCNKNCANYVLKQFKNINIIHIINIAEFINKNKIIVKNKNRQELKNNEKEIVNILTEKIINIIKEKK
jgi:uncharacterized metal-binding protein